MTYRCILLLLPTQGFTYPVRPISPRRAAPTGNGCPPPISPARRTGRSCSAFGVVLLAWGIVTTLAITVIGLVLLALGLGGWIGELRHGH